MGAPSVRLLMVDRRLQPFPGKPLSEPPTASIPGGDHGNEPGRNRPFYRIEQIARRDCFGNLNEYVKMRPIITLMRTAPGPNGPVDRNPSAAVLAPR